MSTKPTEVARWADVGGEIEVPVSGKQDIGWEADERPDHKFFNWIHNVAYLWHKWLYDGDCTFHNLIASGTFSATGAATLTTATTSGLLTSNGGLAVAGTVTQTGGGATSLSGTLAVTGATTLAAPVTLSGSTSGAITLSAGPTPGTYTLGLPSAPSGSIVSPGKQLRMSGLGVNQLELIEDSVFVGGANGQLTSIGLAAGSKAIYDGSAWFFQGASGASTGPVFDVPLSGLGRRIAVIYAYLNKASGAGGTITMNWKVLNMTTGAVVASGTTNTSAAAPGATNLSVTPNTALGSGYSLTVAIDGNASTSGDAVYGVGVLFS